MHDRNALFLNWLFSQLQTTTKLAILPDECDITPLTGDAGFRRYFRVTLSNKNTYIGVDAPPKYSNNQAFVNLSSALEKTGVHVPKIFGFDEEQGFLLIEDLGDVQFADVLNTETLMAKYQLAIDELVKINSIALSSWSPQLPNYDDAFVLMELTIFKEWLLGEYLNIALTDEDESQLSQCFKQLVLNVAQQPKVVMHRDYHSRNLMMAGDELCVIDFQDAVAGALTYDIVSLLRDCYKRLPDDVIDQLFDYFIEQLSAKQPLLANSVTRQQWQVWFDLMGLQRHIKASGIFARLKLRDSKAGYIKDIPLTLTYIIDVAAKYDDLQWLSKFVERQVLPKVMEKLS